MPLYKHRERNNPEKSGGYEGRMLRNCLKFIHLLKVLQSCCFLAIGTSFTANAQVGRAPANFVPDDDKILVPMVVEKSMMDEFHEKHAHKFKNAKQKIKTWMAQEEYAEVYGFENSGVVPLPTAEEKQKFFERNYLRFITKDIERSANRNAKQSVEEWYEDFNSDDELAAIEAQEAHEEFIIKARKNRGQKENKIEKEVKVGKSRIHLDVQPRVEIGMVKIRFRSPFLKARAWVGINGNQEIQLERRFNSTQTNAEVNYFIEQKRVLASVDQRLTRNLSLRLTHDKIDADGINALEGKSFENNVVQLRFGMGF
ncbi:MAG: hypothetical protein CME64_14450 [Halobacteriovoraceae bacterium]|nr:hypothetical protein [Halobacteriovoraceae bacterium]